MDELTKAAFWNGIAERHPLQMDRFQKWIDKYKMECNWHYLFGRQRRMPEKPNDVWPSWPKYHDLPAAMQFGIFIQYALETTNGHGFSMDLDGDFPTVEAAFAMMISNWFASR